MKKPSMKPAVAKSITPSPTALALVTADKELALTVGQVGQLKVKVDALAITDKTLKTANEMLVQVKQLTKGLEARREFFTRRLRDDLKEKDAYFAQQARPLKEADKALREKLSAYHLEAQEKAAEAARKAADLETKRQEAEAKAARARKVETKEAAQEKVRELVQEQETAIATAASAPTRLAVAAGSTVASSTRWDFEVEDVAKLPPEYLLKPAADIVAIRRAVDAGLRDGKDGTRAIPGVRIFPRVQLAVGGR